MNSFIGGSTVGTQYSQLQVSGTATLAGTLTVTLASGFTPAVNSTFNVLTAASVTKTFSNSTIAINASEHFVVSYTSTSVMLTVVSGAALQSSGATPTALAAVDPRKRQLVPLGGGKYRVGTVPNANNRFFVASLQKGRERSGIVFSLGDGVRHYEIPHGPPVTNAANWAATAPVHSLGQPRGSETMNRNVPRSDVWKVEGRSPFIQHVPAIAMPTRHLPIRMAPPIVAKIGR